MENEKMDVILKHLLFMIVIDRYSKTKLLACRNQSASNIMWRNEEEKIKLSY